MKIGHFRKKSALDYIISLDFYAFGNTSQCKSTDETVLGQLLAPWLDRMGIIF